MKSVSIHESGKIYIIDMGCRKSRPGGGGKRGFGCQIREIIKIVFADIVGF